MPSVLVTGTSGGIGEQIALYVLGQPNTKVFGVARRAAPDSLMSNPNYQHIQGDLTSEATLENIKQTIGPKLDGAVFNAGILDAVTKLAVVDLNAFRRVFDINLFSVVALTKAVLPALRNAHGKAIYVSSEASTTAFTAWAAYGASKAAINMVAASLAVEEPEIVAVSVEPGLVDTQMQVNIRENHVKSGEMSPEEAAEFASLKESGRLVSPETVGAIYGRLALSATKEHSGKYYHFNDPAIN